MRRGGGLQAAPPYGSNGGEGAGAVDAGAFFGRVEGFPDVGAALGVEPEIGGVAEDASEDEGVDGAAVVTEFVDVLAGDAHGVGQGALGEGVWVEELFGEDFADGGGFAGCGKHGLTMKKGAVSAIGHRYRRRDKMEQCQSALHPTTASSD